MNKYQKWLISIVIVLILAGIGACSYYLINKNNNTDWLDDQKEVGDSAVWSGLTKCGENWPEKWTDCNIDCFYDNMKLCEASTDAIAFSRLFSEKAYLEEFREMGKVDLGWVTFPIRANTNQEVYLLNGSPSLISTVISEEPISDEMNDPLYSEMKNKYNDASLWNYSSQFIKKESLQNNSERYVFQYRFINGCHACGTEYLANIGFDFDADGKFFKTAFLQIVKGELDTSYAQQYQENNEENTDQNVYKNEKYGFEFKYSPSYILKEYNSEYIYTERGNKPVSDITIEIRSDSPYEANPNLSFLDFTTNEIIGGCASDGPSGSTRCTSVNKIDYFENDQGVLVYKIFVNQVVESYNGWQVTGTKTEDVIGPFFAIDMSDQTKNKARSIIFENNTRDKEQAIFDEINKMTSTFKFYK